MAARTPVQIQIFEDTLKKVSSLPGISEGPGDHLYRGQFLYVRIRRNLVGKRWVLFAQVRYVEGGCALVSTGSTFQAAINQLEIRFGVLSQVLADMNRPKARWWPKKSRDA